jgi:hypothetical protein
MAFRLLYVGLVPRHLPDPSLHQTDREPLSYPTELSRYPRVYTVWPDAVHASRPFCATLPAAWIRNTGTRSASENT